MAVRDDWVCALKMQARDRTASGLRFHGNGAHAAVLVPAVARFVCALVATALTITLIPDSADAAKKRSGHSRKKAARKYVPATKTSKKGAQKAAPISDRSPFIGAATTATKGRGGVGMVLDGRGDMVVVSRVVAGGPAARGGVLAGDIILDVNGWKVPAKPTVSKVAARIRGRIGTPCEITVRRKKAKAPVGLTIIRGSMASLFPQLSAKVIAIDDGVALLATAGGHTIGIRFIGAAKSAGLIGYQWRLGPARVALGQPALEGDTRDRRTGAGVVTWTRAGATIQVAGWRLQLAPWPGREKMIVRASNRPVAITTADKWLKDDPRVATYVRPRDAPRPYRETWNGGPCKVKIAATVDGKKAANRRLTMWLVRSGSRGLPTQTVQTDDEGNAAIRLPAADYRLTGLYSSLNGGASDLYYDAEPEVADLAIRCKNAGNDVALTLQMKKRTQPPRPMALSLPTSATSHPFVGRSLPSLNVRKWHGDASTVPKRLKKRVMLIYVWATWCGPCKRVSPLVAELHARLAKKGLVVVSASVDRDGAALKDYAGGQLDGAAPIAWLGPTAMNRLQVSGIPSVFVVDHKGVVRAVHTGTGAGLKAWSALIEKLLTEAR